MTVTKLIEKKVEKVWGRRDLPDMFGGVWTGPEPLGEIWFEHPERRDVDLLVKFLFTSERLSIQVHPDDEAAREEGHRRGKDEAWVVLRADCGAEIGLGMRCAITKQELARAARNGSIESLIDWRRANAGDVLYSPAGTVHAIGAGLVLIEIQQNADLTYRLYDYGRPRDLHVEKGVEVANPAPVQTTSQKRSLPNGRDILAEGRAFVLERWHGTRAGKLRPGHGRPLWLVPLKGRSHVAGEVLKPGGTWLIEGAAEYNLDPDSELLLAYPGAMVEDALSC